MPSEKPRQGELAGPQKSIAADTSSPTPSRRKIQANEAMRQRLNWLAKLAPYPLMEARHG